MTESTTLLRGELGQQPFRHYRQIVVARLRYTTALRRRTESLSFSLTRWRCQFSWVKRRRTSMCRYSVVDENTGTVAASLMGENDGRILASFPPTPPTSASLSSWPPCIEDLERITVSSFYWK